MVLPNGKWHQEMNQVMHTQKLSDKYIVAVVRCKILVSLKYFTIDTPGKVKNKQPRKKMISDGGRWFISG